MTFTVSHEISTVIERNRGPTLKNPGHSLDKQFSGSNPDYDKVIMVMMIIIIIIIIKL